MMNKLFIMFTLLLLSCTGQFKKNQPVNTMLHEVLNVVHEHYSSKCIDVFMKSRKISLTHYNNYNSFRNDYIYHNFIEYGSGHQRFRPINSNFKKRFDWLRRKYKDRPFWHISTRFKTTNLHYVQMGTEMDLFVDSLTGEIIHNPVFDRNFCKKVKSEINELENYVQKLSTAALPFIKTEVEENGIDEINNKIKPYGRTLMSNAIWSNQTDVALFLIKKGHPITLNDLKASIAGGMQQVVEAMLEMKIISDVERYVEILKFSDQYFQNEVAETLNNYAPSLSINDEWFKFLIAIRTGDVDAVKLFIKSESFKTDYRFKYYENTPVVLAIMSNKLDVVKLLIESGYYFPKSEDDQLKYFEILSLYDSEKALEIASILKAKNSIKDYIYYFVYDRYESDNFIQKQENCSCPK